MSDPTQPTPPATRSGGRFAPAIYLLGLAAGFLIGFHPTILSGFARMQTDPGDTPLNHYFLEHTWRWASYRDYPATFWSPRFFYPTAHTLTYSENMIGVAPLYWGLRLAFSDEIAFQWWVLILCAANYAAMVVVLRWFGAGPVLAVLGGILFAFGLPRQDQFAHQQLLPHAIAPFAVYFFAKFLRQPNRRGWFLILVLTAWQLLASIHLGWFLLFALALLFLILAILERGTLARVASFLRRDPIFAGGTLALWAGGLWLFFRTYFLGNRDVRRLYIHCLNFMPEISAWFAGPPHSAWGLSLVPGGDELYPERHLFTGLGFYAVLALGALAAWRMRSRPESRGPARFAIACLAAGLLMVLLALHYGGGFSPWYVVNQFVPGGNSIRVPGRIYFSVILLGLIGALPLVQRFLDGFSPPRRGAIAVGLLLLCAGEQVRFEMDSFRRDDFYPRTHALARDLAGADAAYVRFDPALGMPKYEHEITAMWAGLRANVPVVNGYSGREPPGYFYDGGNLPVAEVVSFLGDDWRGRLLIVDWGDPPRKRSYDVRPGPDPERRITPAH
jgi:hypothetical protein